MIVTGRQIAAARTLLGLNQPELAERAKISAATLKRMEGSPGQASGLPNNVEAVRRALEAAGVLFIPEDRHGPGVRLRLAAPAEAALGELLRLHDSSDAVDRVDAIAAGFSAEDRDALAAVFGNRVWGETRREADARGCEIQDRLTRTGAFRA